MIRLILVTAPIVLWSDDLNHPIRTTQTGRLLIQTKYEHKILNKTVQTTLFRSAFKIERTLSKNIFVNFLRALSINKEGK